MIDLNLAELDRLEREASAGPWTKRGSNYPVVMTDDHRLAEIAHIKPDAFEGKRMRENAALITAARNQLRPLLDLVGQMGELLVEEGDRWYDHRPGCGVMDRPHTHRGEPCDENHPCSCELPQERRDAIDAYLRVKGE